MINLFNLVKAYWRGFAGGPDFTCSIQHRFILEDKQLTIGLPESNLMVAPSHIKSNFPHSSSRWFSQHAQINRQHAFVHMITKNWMYVPPIAIAPSSEYGMLSCQVRIKQINEINVLDKAALGQFIIQACDNYNNGPDGSNTQINKEVEEQFRRSSCTWTREEIEAEISIAIELNGEAPLAPAITKSFNQLTWVFYQEPENNSYSHQDYYCLPLSKNSFLEVKFNHRVDLSHKHKKWAKPALEAQERIMASIYLDDLPLTQDQRVEHSSVSGGCKNKCVNTHCL
jgi:hypothetical protein